VNDDTRWRHYGRIVAAVALLWYAVVAWLVRVPVVATRNDDAVYLGLAEALKHLTYRDAYLVGAPFHSMYPPGYPAFLALLDVLPGDRLSVLHGANILLVIIAIVAVADVVRTLWSPVLGLTIILVCATNMELALTAGRVMAEPLYLSLTSGALWASVQSTRGRSRAMTGLLAIGAALARSVGLTMVVATGLHWLFQRQWRAAAWFGLAALGSVGLWLAWTVFAPDLPAGRSYIADAVQPSDGYEVGVLGQIGVRLRDNLSLYVPRALPHVLGVPSIPGTPIDNVFWIPTLVVLITIGLAKMARAWPLAVWYVAVYCTLIAVWPWADSRFLIPLIPILITAIVVALQVLGLRFAGRRHRLIIGLFVAVLVLAGVVRQVRAVADFAPCRVEAPLAAPGCFNEAQRAYIAGARYTAGALPQNAVVVAAKGAAFGHYAGRKVYPLWMVPLHSPNTLLDHLAGAGVEYVFVGRLRRLEYKFALLLQQECQGMVLARAFPPYAYLFRLAPEASSPADSRRACDAISAYVGMPWEPTLER